MPGTKKQQIWTIFPCQQPEWKYTCNPSAQKCTNQLYDFVLHMIFKERYPPDKVKHMDNIDAVGEIESHLYKVKNYSSLLWNFS